MSKKYQSQWQLTRRVLIAQSMALLLAKNSFGLGMASRFDVGELMLPTGTLSRPGAWRRALFELIQTTSIETNGQSFQIPPESPELFVHPFCVMIGEGGFAPLSKKYVAMLQRF